MLNIFSKKKTNESEVPADVEFECEYCKKTFKTFRRTVNLVTEVIYMKCPVCEKKLSSEKVVWKHRKLMLEDEWALAGTRVMKEEEEIAMKYDESEKAEQESQKKEKEYKCKLCDEVFTKPVHIRYHYKKVHSQKEPEPPKEKEPEVVTADYKEPEKSEYLDEVVKDEELMIDDNIPIKTYDENPPNEKDEFSDLV